MSLLTYCTKFLRRYILCPESLIFVCIAIVIYNTLLNFAPLWQKARDKLKFKSPQLPTNSEASVSVEHSWNKHDDPYKSSWEDISGSAAVYAIQGRRPHMEDRYEILKKNENFSLYGIFDGHGGDVCLLLIKLTNDSLLK